MKKMKNLLIAAIATTLLALGTTSPAIYAATSTTSTTTTLTPITAKQFLMVSYLKDPTTPITQIIPFAKPEAQLAWQYYTGGRILQMNARQDGVGVVILWQAKNQIEARAAIEAMPMVQAGLIAYKLIPVAPFASLSSLFGTDAPADRAAATTINKPNRFVVITRPALGTTADKVLPYAKDQALAIWQNYETGIVAQMFDRPGVNGGSVIMMRADDMADAQQIVNNLPLVKNNLIKYDIYPVGHFFPFGDLFAK
jgi:uncharacterized protein YciI